MRIKSLFDKKNYTQELKKLKLLNEYRKWYDGESQELLKYYKRGEYIIDKTEGGLTDTSLMTKGFYMLAPVGAKYNTPGGYQLNSFSVLHRPLAKVISRTFAVLIAGQAPIIEINTKRKERTKQTQEEIDEIMEVNDLSSKLQLAVEYESYSGAVAFKPILTDDVDAPLFQIYPKDRFIINESFESILNSVVFVDYFNEYTLLSEYGRGFIRYKLLDKNGKEVPLSEVEEIADLEDIELYDKDGHLYNKVLAVVQKNRGTGESDYKDQIDNFQAVDEAFSIMVNLIRKSQPKRIVSESSLVNGQDSNGNPVYYMPDSYDSDVIIMWDNKREGSQEDRNELQATPNIQNPIQAYRETIDSALLDIASSVGLSSKTLSGVEEAGANASAEALGLRSNADYRTRDLKTQSWNKSLRDLVQLMLTMKYLEGNRVSEMFDDIEITINFYDPANFQAGTPTVKQKLETIVMAYDKGLIDLKGALDFVWSDTMSEDEIEELFSKLQVTTTTPEVDEEGNPITNKQPFDGQDADDDGIDESELVAQLKEWGLDEDDIKSFLADLKEAKDDDDEEDEEDDEEDKVDDKK